MPVNTKIYMTALSSVGGFKKLNKMRVNQYQQQLPIRMDATKWMTFELLMNYTEPASLQKRFVNFFQATIEDYGNLNLLKM